MNPPFSSYSLAKSSPGSWKQAPTLQLRNYTFLEISGHDALNSCNLSSQGGKLAGVVLTGLRPVRRKRGKQDWVEGGLSCDTINGSLVSPVESLECGVILQSCPKQSEGDKPLHPHVN